MEKKNKIILVVFFSIIVLSLVIISAVSSYEKTCKKIEFYYNPSCPHCKEVYPLVQQYSKFYPQWKFDFIDVVNPPKSYLGVEGVPTIKIYPGDGREIILVGSEEIPKYLKCELEEKSSLECPTHLELKRGSYFIE